MYISTFRKITTISLVVWIGVMVIVGAFQPALAIAQTTDNVTVSLTVDSGVAITSPSDVALSPNLSMSVNSSIGSATWNVKTNDSLGYTLTVKSSTTPALKHQTNAAWSFADYTEAIPGTPDTWSVDANTYQFGTSARGTDVNTTTYGTGANCGSAGTPSNTLKWRGASTTAFTVAAKASTTTTSGVDTEVCFAAAQNGVYAPSGSYQATIIATVTAN